MINTVLARGIIRGVAQRPKIIEGTWIKTKYRYIKDKMQGKGSSVIESSEK